MAVIILAFTVAVLAVALLSLYQRVGLLGRQMDTDSGWPFGDLSAGQAIPELIPSEQPAFTGFAVLCADDSDALGAVFSCRSSPETGGTRSSSCSARHRSRKVGHLA